MKNYGRCFRFTIRRGAINLVAMGVRPFPEFGDIDLDPANDEKRHGLHAPENPKHCAFTHCPLPPLYVIYILPMASYASTL
jgi:hypothetical protein